MAGTVIPLDLPSGLSASLARGHPWVYRNQVPGDPDLPTGTWVQANSGGWRGFGLWDARSPIAVRLFSRHGIPDAAWVAARVREAWEARAPVRAGQTTGYRWVYGESDGLPGIVVDLYGDFAAIHTYARAVDGLVPWVADALHAHTPLRGIVWRPTEGEPRPLWGQPPPSDLVIEEHGLLFHADLLAGQKTGLYFDQRDNRRSLAAWCQGQAVLDCFCYTGAFALYALRGGAASVTACDGAASALQAAQRNLALNGFDPGEQTFLEVDCFQLLEQYAGEGRRFDVVVLDPPSMARSREGRRAAERAYERLNRWAMQVVRPGGLLASASCTSQVSPETFRGLLAEAARRAGRRLLILHEAGHAADHPVPAHFPEARYLKFILGRLLPLA